MYLIVNIDKGGYICALGGSGRYNYCIHRDTIVPDLHKTVNKLEEAKKEFPTAIEFGILGLDETGRGKEVWVYPESVEYWKDKLKIWSGCYGAWTIRKLNKEN